MREDNCITGGNVHCFHRAYHYTTFTLLIHVLYWLDNTCLVCWDVSRIILCSKGVYWYQFTFGQTIRIKFNTM